MNFDDVTLGGVSVILLVLGIVETAKEWGVTGKWSRLLAIALGTFFVGIARAIDSGLIPAGAQIWIAIVVYGIGGGLAAAGVFDLIKKATRC